MKLKLFRIISVLLVILFMMLIFSLSGQTADKSSELSGGLTYKAFSIFYPHFSEMSREEQKKVIESFSFPVRKLAHFTLYAVLGMLSFIALVTYNLPLWAKCVMSQAVSSVYAVTDEFHQTFIDGRSGEIRDVLIDSGGALTGIALLVLLLYYVIKSKWVSRNGQK